MKGKCKTIINHLSFSTTKSDKGVYMEIIGLDVWESFTKKQCLKIAWFMLTKVLFR